MIRNLGISNVNMQRLLNMFPNFLWPLKVMCLRSLVNHGKKFQLGPNVKLYNYREITVGDNVFIGDGTTIAGKVAVTIGNNVMLGPEVMMRGGDHNFSVIGKPMAAVKNGGINLPITIENDVWIGTRVIILKGVKIREGSVIAAGALLNREVPPYCLAVGAPAKPIKPRFTTVNDLKMHLFEVGSAYGLNEVLAFYEQYGIEIDER